jgi:hypothetical protein
MPRPDLAAVGVKYRRIPVLSIGRGLYCDSALILQKLERLCLGNHVGGIKGTDKAFIKLLRKWTELDVLIRACETIPPDFPAIGDPTSFQDREELWNRDWSKARQERTQAKALSSMMDNFDLKTMTSDGQREWILESGGPFLAEINGVFLLLELLRQIQHLLG